MKQIDRSDLTPRGEKVAHVYDATKDLGKKALIATAATVATVVPVAAGYDTFGPHKTVNSSTIDIGNFPSRNGDVTTISDKLVEMGEDPNKLADVVTEAQSARPEAEKAGTTVATINVMQSPLFNNEKVEVTFSKEDS